MFIQFSHSSCSNKIYLIPSQSIALRCGVIDGFFVGSAFAVIIALLGFFCRNSINNITQYCLFLILVSYIICIVFFGYNSVTAWNFFQNLIKTYKSQGLTNDQIYQLFENQKTNGSI